MKTATHRGWWMHYFASGRGRKPQWHVMTSYISNGFVFSGTIEECKAWIDEREDACEQHYAGTVESRENLLADMERQRAGS
jgi:hypothetical protein